MAREKNESKGTKGTKERGGKTTTEVKVANERSEGSDRKVLLEETPPGSEAIPGKINMMERVVAKIAALAAQEVPGIYALGKARLLSFGAGQTRGVAAEVGEREAALDLEIVLEHGSDVRKVAKALRQRVSAEVDRMAGRKVVELNIDVIDIHLPEPLQEPAPPPEAPRVQ